MYGWLGESTMTLFIVSESTGEQSKILDHYRLVEVLLLAYTDEDSFSGYLVERVTTTVLLPL